MMACLPCMLSYGWIFDQILRRSPQVEGTFCWPLVRDYAGSRYDAICAQWSSFTDQACRDLAPERRERCRAIFQNCSLHELRFWEMSALPRTDI